MQKVYHQLSLEQRYQIEAFNTAGYKQNLIATLIGVHPSTISRELKRNTPAAGVGGGTYWATNAQRRTTLRHKEKPKRILFCKEMKRYCRRLLNLPKYSPAIISATGRQCFEAFPCHETIYKWIWNSKRSNRKDDKKDRNLYKLLRHACRKRKRGNRNDRRGIYQAGFLLSADPK